MCAQCGIVNFNFIKKIRSAKLVQLKCYWSNFQIFIGILSPLKTTNATGGKEVNRILMVLLAVNMNNFEKSITFLIVKTANSRCFKGIKYFSMTYSPKKKYAWPHSNRINGCFHWKRTWKSINANFSCFCTIVQLTIILYF